MENRTKELIELLLMPLVLAAIFFALACTGCSKWQVRKYVQYADGRAETTTASQSQCLMDSSRTAISAKIDGVAQVSIGTSNLDAQEVADILRAVPELAPLLKMWGIGQ